MYLCREGVTIISNRAWIRCRDTQAVDTCEERLARKSHVSVNPNQVSFSGAQRRLRPSVSVRARVCRITHRIVTPFGVHMTIQMTRAIEGGISREIYQILHGSTHVVEST